MPFNRVSACLQLPEGDELTESMAGIGMRFAAEPAPNPNIEDTLLAASFEGMENDDLRVLSVLVTWIDRHYRWIHADRLIRAVPTLNSVRARAFWAATAGWLQRDRRFARLARYSVDPRIDLFRIGSDFHLGRQGEDPRFEASCLRIPKGVLRERSSDVLDPEALAKLHRTYRRRVQMGPSYRADMWSELEGDPSLNPAELARRTYGSFATAWRVKTDWEILAAAG